MLGRTTVRGLQAGSAAAGIGAILTTVDLTLCAGGGTLIASALAANEAFKKSDELTQNAALRLGEALDQELAKSDLTPGRQDIVLKMLKHYWPQHIEIADGDRNATKVLAKMVERIAEKPLDDDVNERAVEDFKRIVEPALEAALEPLTEEEAIQKVSLERSAETRDDVKAMRAELADVSKMLRAKTEQSGDYQKLREAGITEKAILALIESAVESTDNLGQAWIELENRFSSAVSVQEEGRITSNHGDFVDTVLRRVAELSRDGEYKGALSEIEDAIAKQEAEKARLLDSGVKVAMVDGDPAVAADLLVRRTDLEAGGRATFEELRALQSHFWISGRDKGINLHSKIAIETNRINLDRTSSHKERGIAGIDLGTALQTLGERERNDSRLLEAVDVLDAAAEHWKLQNDNHGWALAKMNFGGALTSLGERVPDSEYLERAATAYEEALSVLSKSNSAFIWASTKMNLGIAQKEIGIRKNEIGYFLSAVSSIEDALDVFTKESDPKDWANAKSNLGNARRRIALTTNDVSGFELAIEHFKEALMVHTREEYPIAWAMTQGNMANIHIDIFEVDFAEASLNKAEDGVTAALEVFESLNASQYVGMAQQQLARIEKLREGLPG